MDDLAPVGQGMTEVRAVASRAAQQFLAFDIGTKRTGVAVGSTITRSAQPLKSIVAAGDARFVPIAALIEEWQPSALVVGVPRHSDGAAHAMTTHAQRFARQLHGRFGLMVHEVDERYSSVEAQSRGAQDIDAESACVILEQFLKDTP